MIRRPPRSTLFPTRRSSDLGAALFDYDNDGRLDIYPIQNGGPKSSSRSEEHTSELQSHSDLVCRLLLEKKKSTQKQLLSCHASRNLACASFLLRTLTGWSDG